MRDAATRGDRVLMVLAPLLGGGSLVLFAVWPRGLLDLHLGDPAALALDALLSLAFFVQHSGMVRRPFKARLARHVPERQVAAIYSVASGVALSAVVVLWQRTEGRAATVEGPARWIALALAALALAGFAWAVRSLRGFDAFGDRALRRHALGKPERPPSFSIRGPYRWVRHPLYLLVLVLLWANVDLRWDRLLLDALWTAWIVVGTVLEERDLAVELGQPYREYQRRVPMLLPWRRPAPESPPG